MIKNNWTKDEIKQIYNLPLLELIYKSATTHRKYFDHLKIQVSSLLSIKTGACEEDCKYCSQSSRYNTEVSYEPMISEEAVIEIAKQSKLRGASRFCLGASGREIKNKSEFETVLRMVSQIKNMSMEVCCTLGMLTYEQALSLKKAGLDYYNHNIDTSEEFYGNVITTRTFNDRLTTIRNVKRAGLKVCCGGILGLGENDEDRISMLQTLATFPEHPESVPVNMLVRIDGTPLENAELLSVFTLIRTIATARILMPRSFIRLSAGRSFLSFAEQSLCFLSGANSIFEGDKLLTTPNITFYKDEEMFSLLGLSKA